MVGYSAFVDEMVKIALSPELLELARVRAKEKAWRAKEIQEKLKLKPESKQHQEASAFIKKHRGHAERLERGIQKRDWGSKRKWSEWKKARPPIRYNKPKKPSAPKPSPPAKKPLVSATVKPPGRSAASSAAKVTTKKTPRYTGQSKLLKGLALGGALGTAGYGYGMHKGYW